MEADRSLWTRRTILKLAPAVGTFTGLVSSERAWGQTTLRQTPEQILGPFYPVSRTPDTSGDLTRIPGHANRAKGQVLLLSGRVLDKAGEPISGARVEIWQANAAGRYTHPGDTSTTLLDPDFDGFGVVTTDADGRYRFKTIKPAPYATGPTTMRPAHIHFQVLSRADRLITQMYFEGDPYNAQDRILQNTRRPEALIVKMAPGPDGAASVVFDIVVRA